MQDHKNHKNHKCQGNTKPDTKNEFRCRRWVLTWNNYTVKDYEELQKYCEDSCIDFILGKEVGKQGTPHIQGYLEFKHVRKFSALHKRFPKIHFEKAKGTKSQNHKYCSKDNNFTKKLTFQEKLHQSILKEEYENITWKPWQNQVIEYCNSKPDSRKIFWVYDKLGNRGKSFLAKYIWLKFDCILADGKKDNIFNQTKLFLENEKEPRIILLDVPRYNIEYINYGVLEQLKNGLIYSGKYEGGVCAFRYPHVIVFANIEPEYHKMSEDRWNIIEITE